MSEKLNHPGSKLDELEKLQASEIEKRNNWMLIGDKKVVRPNDAWIIRDKNGKESIWGYFDGSKDQDGDIIQNELFFGDATEENIQALIDAGVIAEKEDLKNYR